MEVTEVKNVQTVQCLPNPPLSDQTDFNGVQLNSEAFLALPLIEKAVFVADNIAKLIKGKLEPVNLTAFYNRLLQDYSAELVRQIAAVDNETRANLVKTLFLEIVRAVHKE